ncbi:hypothetical protein HUJ05_009963 [Dendroctonus ponderosae]|nr:hypothetical protein HUJ05_009963 [Dendroctonus ponderosae]
MSTIKKSIDEQDPTDFDASDVSDIELFADAGLRERMSRLTIEERIRYLEGVRKHLKSRREAEVFTQGIIIDPRPKQYNCVTTEDPGICFYNSVHKKEPSLPKANE